MDRRVHALQTCGLLHDPISMQMHAYEVSGTVDSCQISPEPALELIVDELLDLYIHGVTAHNASGEALKVYAQLLFPIADYPGLGSILGPAMKQAPTPHACYLTWHSGTWYSQYKRIYNTHAK